MAGPGDAAELGRRGEDLAARYLVGLGFSIVARNVRTRRAEIDLIARDAAGVVLVEVKTRRDARYGFPYEAVDKAKRERILDAAAEVMAAHGLLEDDYRLGIISIVVPPAHQQPVIEWIDEA